MPAMKKGLEYFEKKGRIQKYMNSIRMKSDFYRNSKAEFRKRTYKRNKDMNNFL